MHQILLNEPVVPNMRCMVVSAPEIARQIQPGQFVIVRADEDGERIPLSVSDWDTNQGTLTLIFMEVGGTTGKLAALLAGNMLPTVVGPLGNPTEIDKFGTVMCVAGCYGMGSIYPIVRALKEKGNKTITVMEARSSYLLYWEDRLKGVSDRVITITRDGTKGYRGHVSKVPEIMKILNQPVNRIIINGCTYLMKRGSDMSRPYGIKTIVSLNPIMIDGTGMCGVCRVTVGKETRFACVHGPDFDGHLIDWQEMLQRRKSYMVEEETPVSMSKCEEHQITIQENIA
jgi:ferredoxin/flavodoxin---NADP+ reductase